MSPRICGSGPRRYIKRTEPPLRSGFVGRPPATLEKRSPINHFEFAKFYILSIDYSDYVRCPLLFKQRELLQNGCFTVLCGRVSFEGTNRFRFGT